MIVPRTIASILLFFALWPAHGQDAPDLAISVSVDKDTISLDEQLNLQVTVTGTSSSLPEPILPPMPGFQVYSSGKSQSVAMTDGRLRTSVVYAYALVPRFVGPATIPRITVKVYGVTRESSPMTVTVLRPGAAKPKPIRKLIYSLPQGGGASKVLIVIVDSNGEREIFNGVRPPGSRIDLALPDAGGSAKARIFINGILIEERQVRDLASWADGGQDSIEAAVPKPKAPAKLSAEVSFSEPSGNRILDAEESGTLAVKVANSGQGPAYAARLVLSTEKPVAGLTVPPEIDLGTIAPGKTSERTVELKASQSIVAGPVRLKLEVKEGNGFDAPPVLVEFETRAFQAPKLEVSGLVIGGAGVIKAGEVSSVAVTVRNAGPGAAQGVAASLELGSPDLFPSGETSAPLGTLGPGESKKAAFEFVVNNRFKGKALPVSVKVAESRGRFGLTAPLNLALGETAPSMTVVAIKGRPFPAAPPAAAPIEESVDSPPRSAAPIDPEAYAVVVGIERYRDIPGVDYATRDAQIMHAYLTRAMGFDEKNVVLLQNERATRQDLDKHLGTWLKNHADSPKSRVFVFYAGHGAPNPETGEGYLIPYEGDPNYTEDTAYPIKRLYDNLAKLPTKDVTVVLDACFSGAGGRSVMAKARPLLTKLKDPGRGGENTVVLSAAAADQISVPYAEGQHGLLTYFLLKGLKGEADLDKDGAVTTKEIFSYLQPAVERQARRQNFTQTPTLSPSLDSLGEAASRVWLRTRQP